jgi:hypothetical protein
MPVRQIIDWEGWLETRRQSVRIELARLLAQLVLAPLVQRRVERWSRPTAEIVVMANPLSTGR